MYVTYNAKFNQLLNLCSIDCIDWVLSMDIFYGQIVVSFLLSWVNEVDNIFIWLQLL